MDGYYRGTLLGAGRLAHMAHLAATPDEPGISPELKRMRDDARREYQRVVLDLARYDRMRSAVALLKIIAQGEADVAAGRLLSQEEAFARATRAIDREG